MKGAVFKNRTIVLVITALIGSLLLYAFRGLTIAFLGVLLMYCLMRPFLLIFHRRWGLNKYAAGVAVLLISIFTVVLPAYLVLQLVLSKVNQWIANPNDIEAAYQQSLLLIKAYLPDASTLMKALADFRSVGLSWISGILSISADLILQLVVMYFTLYFLFVDFDKFEKALFYYSPFRPSNTRKFANEFKAACYANVLGQGLVALAQGLLLALGFAIFGAPDPWFWGALAVFAAFIPFIGTALIYVPIALYLLAKGDGYHAAGMMIYGAVLVGSADNFLRILVSKRFYNTHPLISFLGITVGLPLFGLLGLVYGPFLLTFFLLLVKVCEELYSKSPKRVVK
ncbi:MAG TPA: AI-2E family transporter [Luteibaculaceae bacterium]|nr:AI-2E family transporter [Luteibaculaceae bacterium]